MPAIEQDKARLAKLVAAGHGCIAICGHEEDDALELVRHVAAEQRNGRLAAWSATRGIHSGLFGDGYNMERPETRNAAGGLHALQRDESWTICYLLDAVSHLRDEVTLRALRDLIAHARQRERTVVMIDHQSELPPVVAAHATMFDLSLPNDKEIERIVRGTLRRLHNERAIEINMSRQQFGMVLKNLSGLSRRQIQQIVVDVVRDDRRLCAEDVNHILAGKRQALGRDGLLEYVETPLDLSSVGGLERLKTWLHRRRGADAQEAVAFGLTSPRGVLMLGVQGAGKSMCAKAIATVWQRPLLRLDPSALYDRYIGESERRLREALQQAEAMAPIVLWIDEIEKGFASASSRSNDGGLSQRMFGTLLTWMQEHTAPVFMVATANDIEALPPELLRKGRFDEIFFVDLPPASTRREIFAIHLTKRGREVEKFDLEALVAASEGYSGAEIEQAIVSGLHDAFAARRELTTPGVVEALRQSPPLSVTMAEKIEALRHWAVGRCVPAD